MSSHVRTALVTLLVGLVTACGASTMSMTGGASDLVTSQAPLPAGYPLSTQQTMQALHHWNLHADKVAAGCAQAMTHFFPQNEPSVFLSPMEATPFARAFREALQTRLVDYGVHVAFEPDGALRLDVTVDYVAHQRKLVSTARGVRDIVAPGFVQQRDENGQYRIPPRVREEAGAFETPVPTAEIQINSALILDGTYLYRDSSIYYVSPEEWAHYRLTPPSGPGTNRHYSLVEQ